MEKKPNQKALKFARRLAIFTFLVVILTCIGVELFERRILLGDSYVPILLAIPGYPLGVLWLFFASSDDDRS